MTTYKYFIGIFATAMSLVSCSDGISLDEPKTADTKPEMQFSFIHPDDRQQSRATETAFETGDKVGLFVNETSHALEIGGNTVNNEMLTCNGRDWFSTETLYWDAGTYNATAYYPYQDEISSITDLHSRFALTRLLPRQTITCRAMKLQIFSMLRPRILLRHQVR